MKGDTIAAISTPIGEGAIGIVRLSGAEAIDIAKKLYQGADLSKVKSHTIHYGKVVEPESGHLVDEVMTTVMLAPRTYTREDVVEINCHGGMVAVNRVLELLLENGARLAEPGEFTKRAFLNGRIDLSQAEGVMDLIRAKTDKAMSVAVHQVEGRLSTLIQKLRNELIETIAQVEVNIDYPEYDDVEEMTHELMNTKTADVLKEINRLLQVARQGKILREGIKTGIIGRPNVGKSSLMNTLVQETKAIVTEIPGTTRDTIEEYVNVRGVPLQLIDTAGIRETEDIVEKLGVERSHQVLKESDLLLFVLNYNESITEDDRKLFEAIKGLQTIIILNKTDLPKKINLKDMKELAKDRPIIPMSVLEDEGIDELEKAIADLFYAGEVETGDFTYVSNARHIQLLKEARRHLKEAREALALGTPLDLVQIDITRSWELLGEIIGDTASEALIDQLFSQFCLGK